MYPLPASSAADPSRAKVHPFTFTGSGGEYFRIWIVNLLLTILTLGIFSAWAKVRRLRYFYGNTTVAGSSFEYHGEPLKILKGRLIAVAFIVPYYIAASFAPLLSLVFLCVFLAALPFIVVNSRRFQTRNSSWRNIRFDFAGGYGKAALIYLGLAILTPLTLGLILPYMMYARQKFLTGRARFGASDVHFGSSVGSYYLAYLIGLATAIVGTIAILLFATWFIGPGFRYAILDPEASLAARFPGQFITIVLMAVYLFYFVYGIVQARLINAAYGNLSIGGHEIKCEMEATELAAIYLGNLLFTSLTLGLYTPWAKVRLARYQADSMQLETRGSLDELLAAASQNVTATGSELGDLLDLDFGL